MRKIKRDWKRKKERKKGSNTFKKRKRENKLWSRNKKEKQSVWLGEILPLWQNFKIIWATFKSFILQFGKSLNLLWQIFYTIGQIHIPKNGQLLKKSLATWSHCFKQSTPSETRSRLSQKLQLLFKGYKILLL